MAQLFFDTALELVRPQPRRSQEYPDEYREVIIYRYYLEMPWDLIGKEMARSTEAVQMLCNRALLKLKRVYFKKD